MAKKELTISEVARMGAIAKNRKLTPEQRSETARKAARARWSKTPRSLPLGRKKAVA